MDAYVSRGARPAACAGGGSQEAEHGTHAVDSDDGEHATDDVDAIALRHFCMDVLSWPKVDP